MRLATLGLLLLELTIAPAGVLLERAEELTARDEQLVGGEYYQKLAVEVTPGTVLNAHLVADYDTYLAVKMPDGRQFASATDLQSRVVCVCASRGTATLVVTSAKPKVTGPYRLHVESLPLAGVMQPERTQSGSLAKGDSVLGSGEYVDRVKLPVKAGDVLLLSLQSSEFDTYLIGSAPGAAKADNDDANGSNSQLCLLAQMDGEADISITSANKGETGAYQLYLKRGQLAPAARPSLLTVTGALNTHLKRLKSGEYAQRYEVVVGAGQAYEIELATEGFEGYVIATAPGAAQREGQAKGSEPARVTGRAVDSGTMVVIVTSAKPGQIGPYHLSVRGTPYAAPGEAKPPQPRIPPGLQVQPEPPTEDRAAEQLTSSGKPLDGRDPKLRLPRLKPTQALVDKPGLVGDVLHRMNRIGVEVSGAHTWIQSCTWPDGDKTGSARYNQDDPRFRADNFHSFGLSNSGALGWPWDGEPDLKTPESNLHWDGDVFTAFRHVHHRDGWAVVDVVGRVSPDGSRILQVQIRTTAEKWHYPDEGGGPLLEARYWQGVGLTDLPLYAARVTGTDAAGNPQIGYENPTLAAFVGQMTSYERGRLGSDGLHYGVLDNPDARDHVLELKHLSLEPYRGRLFEWTNSRVIEYQETAWLDPEQKPSIRLSFERR